MREAIRYLLLPRMEIKNFNAESNQYVAGIPAMTAFTGYGYMLERKICEMGWYFQVDGVAVMLHDLYLHPGHPKCPDALHGTQEKNILAPRIIEEIKGDMRVTLALRLRCNTENKAARAWLKVFDQFDQNDLSCMYEWIFSAPCCGGSCQKINDLKVKDKNDEEMIIHHLRRVHQADSGYFILSRNDLLAQDQAVDTLDAILNSQRRTVQADGKWQRDQSGWLVPLALGYQGIESLQIRSGVRKNAKHIYAEPLTGLGELIPANKLLWQVDLDFTTLFWVHRYQAEQQLYYVTTGKL